MTIVFQNCSSKNSKRGAPGPKFKNFSFYTKIIVSTNYRELISTVAIIFSNFCVRIPLKAFLVPNLRIFIFP